MKELKVGYLITCFVFKKVDAKDSLNMLTTSSLKDGIRNFDSFLREGLIEYLDVNEENNALVCQNLSALE